MPDWLLNFIVPGTAVLLALMLAGVMYKKQYPVRKWHGVVGFFGGLGTAILVVSLPKSRFGMSVIIAAGVIMVVSMAIYKAAELREAKDTEREVED
jgi:hypothetical protein